MDVNHFKKLINEHLIAIEDEIVKLKVLSKPIAPDNAIGRLSRMEAIGERSVYEAALAKATARKERLKDALHRINNDDDYGYCVICEEEITAKRLTALPESSRCVPCLQKIENS